ncbi:MAG TPA: hypothetical protein VJ976_01000 [Ornithinimicrobium sp.]|uniref:hypothetical protein n=1 Tax=Ornithinimicrobium sp. TaxID=1977084 RepID=UPI002B470045|nr:hypothetical protein [Ornithinimicrobium sp.]HKJ10944.1 hypothetical protein [Ornithinimicrobium sp.]
MNAKKVLAVAGLGVGLLSVVAIAAAAAELWWLVTGAFMGVLSVACLAAIDADRRVIALRAQVARDLKRVRKDLSDAAKPQRSDTHEDVVGTVRLLQAQYTGRLDRLQTYVEQTLGASRNAEATDDRLHEERPGS